MSLSHIEHSRIEAIFKKLWEDCSDWSGCEDENANLIPALWQQAEDIFETIGFYE